jgi:hypothetical protein
MGGLAIVAPRLIGENLSLPRLLTSLTRLFLIFFHIFLASGRISRNLTNAN